METALAPLTIVHVVFSSRIAGGERHCVDLALAQRAAGHHVHVVGMRGSAVERALGDAVPFHGLRLPLARGHRVDRLARTLRADVVHGHLGPACKAVARVADARRFGTLHVGYKAHHHAQLDGLICVNSSQRALLGDYAGDVSVIHNWAPHHAPMAGDLRAELGLRADQLLVGSLGRLHESKGMDLLVAAFRAHAPADAALAILGEGKQMPELKRLADGDPRIHLLGFRSDVESALHAMDLFVSPSREEAFPLAILEAMRCGLPVIASATQGPSEMLANQPARMVPIGDVPALGNAIREALSTLRDVPRDLREPVAYDVSGYDREAAVARVVAFYRQVIAGRASRRAEMTLKLSSPHA